MTMMRKRSTALKTMTCIVVFFFFASFAAAAAAAETLTLGSGSGAGCRRMLEEVLKGDEHTPGSSRCRDIVKLLKLKINIGKHTKRSAGLVSCRRIGGGQGVIRRIDGGDVFLIEQVGGGQPKFHGFCAKDLFELV